MMFNIMQKNMPSVMQHSFSQVPRARIPRSQFQMIASNKTTFNADYIIPFYWDWVLPGDTANMRFSAIIRMMTPETPFMDNLYSDFFFFFVPLRLLQNNFQKLMGERVDPDDTIDYATPKLTSPVGGYVPPSDWSAPSTAELASSLQDYFGIPTRVAGITHHNYLGRAYNLIWNEWFRDQNLQDSVVVDKDDGPDTYTDYKLLKRGKRHDYFTSCLPWLQKGVAEDLPLGSS
ncbi:MAG: phage capsid protein, partial [Alphaproteobacteria bacterium]|nr:phage capsid protein [Alphaproteobacteria bacterium]